MSITGLKRDLRNIHTNFYLGQSDVILTGIDSSPTATGWHGISQGHNVRLHQQSEQTRSSISLRDTASSGSEVDVPMIIVNSSVRSLHHVHPVGVEMQAGSQAEADPHQDEVTRRRYASFLEAGKVQ